VLAQGASLPHEEGRDIVTRWCGRRSHRNASPSDLSTVMSPRTVSPGLRMPRFSPTSLCVPRHLLNKCDELERPLVANFYQRCFNAELAESS